MMNTLLLISLTALTAATVQGSKVVTSEMKDNLAKVQRDGISINSSLGRHLIAKSCRVEQAADYANNISFLSSTDIKFLGCHHVTQWASDEEQEEQDDDYNSVRICSSNWPSSHHIIVESSGISEPLPVAETFTFRDGDGHGTSLGDVARLDTLVTVVDGASFLEEMNAHDGDIARSGMGRLGRGR